MSSKHGYHTITGSSSKKICYISIALTAGKTYEWTIAIDKYTPNPWMSFGMDVVDESRKSDDNYSGQYKTHSYGLFLDGNNFRFYANGSQLGQGEGGISDE
eukprot:675801_1